MIAPFGTEIAHRGISVDLAPLHSETLSPSDPLERRFEVVGELSDRLLSPLLFETVDDVLWARVDDVRRFLVGWLEDRGFVEGHHFDLIMGRPEGDLVFVEHGPGGRREVRRPPTVTQLTRPVFELRWLR